MYHVLGASVDPGTWYVVYFKKSNTSIDNLKEGLY